MDVVGMMWHTRIIPLVALTLIYTFLDMGKFRIALQKIYTIVYTI